MSCTFLCSLAVIVSQLLSQEPLPHRRTLKSFSESVPGGSRSGTLQPDSQHLQQTFSHWEVFPSYTFQCFNGNLQLYSERVPFVSDWMQFTVQWLQVSLAYKVHVMVQHTHITSQLKSRKEYSSCYSLTLIYCMQHTQLIQCECMVPFMPLGHPSVCTKGQASA